MAEPKKKNERCSCGKDRLICEECGGDRESHVMRFCDRCAEMRRKWYSWSKENSK